MFVLPSPLEEISHPKLRKHQVRLLVKRDDLIHPEVSGNKWRKLKYNFREAQKLGLKTILTFGGAYSNHIAATAAASTHFGFKSIGIIRGDELNADSNETLKAAHAYGMEFEFVSREEYRGMKLGQNSYRKDTFVIPEGGSNELGIQGVKEIIKEIEPRFETIITSIGTGTTMAGLIASLAGENNILGFSSLKGGFVRSHLREMLNEMNIVSSNYQINTDYHFGGYGKTTQELINFINHIKTELGILLDPIYTGKAFFGVWNMISSGKFDGQTLIFLHTGGLQGIAGYNQKSPQKIHF